jgi:hypothetical protein
VLMAGQHLVLRLPTYAKRSLVSRQETQPKCS